MKRALLLATLLPLLGACRNNPYPLLESINKVALLYGDLDLDEGAYEPVDEFQPYGVSFVFLPPGTGIGGEGAYIQAEETDHKDSGRRVTGTFWELYGGLRSSWGIDRVRPYVSAGFSYAEVEKDVHDRSSDEDDTNWGVYASGGVDFWITDRIALGLEYRHMFRTDIELFGLDSDLDWDVWAVTLGFNF
jgi:opacity protein-like surface antigen